MHKRKGKHHKHAIFASAGTVAAHHATSELTIHDLIAFLSHNEIFTIVATILVMISVDIYKGV